jgi:hypothetical protein
MPGHFGVAHRHCWQESGKTYYTSVHFSNTPRDASLALARSYSLGTIDFGAVSFIATK